MKLACNLEVDGYYVTRILKPTTLALDIVEAVINGEEASGPSLARLIRFSQRNGTHSAFCWDLRVKIYESRQCKMILRLLINPLINR